jgi:hypothetical protein
MKRISYLLFLGFIFSIIASSCSSTETYAQQLNDEQALIKAYIKRNNIVVVSTFPTSLPWVKDGNDIYVKTSSGLYFHMINPGDVTNMDTLKSKYTVVPRFKQYTLDVVSDTISNWNTIDFPYPSSFTYLDLTQSCKGFHEAASYMKRNETEAKLIIPSSYGFTTYMNSVTPMAYDLKIKFLK